MPIQETDKRPNDHNLSVFRSDERHLVVIPDDGLMGKMNHDLKSWLAVEFVGGFEAATHGIKITVGYSPAERKPELTIIPIGKSSARYQMENWPEGLNPAKIMGIVTKGLNFFGEAMAADFRGVNPDKVYDGVKPTTRARTDFLTSKAGVSLHPDQIFSYIVDMLTKRKLHPRPSKKELVKV